MAKYIVTIAPPTPNGDLHLGHISGPFLAADVFARLRRLKKDDVFFTSYSDDYQDYVARKALQLNRNMFDVATKFGTNIKMTLKSIDIEVDIFAHAYENQYYKDAIKLCYINAVKKGAIKQKRVMVPYSQVENQYGYEAFARGICNYCGEESDASQCEACANSPVLEKMGTLTSVFTRAPMGQVEKDREYLDLDQYREFLKALYENNPVRSHLKTFIDQVLDSENLDWFIDRPDGNGIDLTIDQKNMTIHTWFSGIAGYLGASKEYWDSLGAPERHEDFWKDQDTKVINFMGFDCSFSHAIVYPSLVSNLEGYTQNFTQLTNKFLKLEGGDFSTSRNHAIWVNDIIKEYSIDGVRFYLALISPEEEVKNFEMAKFTHWYANFYQPRIGRIEEELSLAENNGFALDNLFTEAEDRHLAEFYSRWEKYTNLDGFSMVGMAAVMQDMLSYVYKLFTSYQQKNALLASLVYLVISKPIHPGLSERLLNKYAINEEIILDQLAQYTESV